MFSNYNYGLIAWSPLAGGFLTGKYNDGIPQDVTNRMNDNSFWLPLEVTKKLFYNSHAQDNTIKSLRELATVAEKEGFKLVHLALAWVIKYKHCDSALIGARTVAQLEDCLKALELVAKWTPEFEGRVNRILGTNPTPRMNFLKWAPYPPSRPVAQE